MIQNQTHMESLVPEEKINSLKVSLEKQPKENIKKSLQNERIRVAFEKLQLSWVRTSVTLLAIGVGAYQYFHERVESGRQGFLKHLNGAQFGVLLVVISFIILLLATIQHHQNLSKLKKEYQEMRYSIGSLLAYFILLLSFSISVMVLFKI